MTTESMAAAGGDRPTGQDALAVLRRQYEGRLDALGGRTGLVGVIGNAAPVELILAAGKQPVLVAPEPPHPTPHADPWMEPELAWEERSIVERALRGDFERFDLLIVTRSYHLVYYYLKEIVRQGQGTTRAAAGDVRPDAEPARGGQAVRAGADPANCWPGWSGWPAARSRTTTCARPSR